MSKLDELLSPAPTEGDNDVQHALIGEFIKLAGMKDAAPGWYGETRQMFVHSRLSLVRATLQEAAKLVCPLCDIGYPLVLGLNDGETGSQYEHENRGYNQGKCPASFIHARLAKEKP